MGLFDWLPCCGPRERKEDPFPRSNTAESSHLLPPHRADSLLSAEGSYGAVDTGNAPPTGGLSGEQKARIEEIGREAGGHMLHINSMQKSRSTSNRQPNQTLSTDRESSSGGSSRPSSPSPLRPDTSPSGGFMRSDTIETNDTSTSPERSSRRGSELVEVGEGVVRKTVFLGGLQGGPPRKVSGNKRGKGKSRGKAK